MSCCCKSCRTRRGMKAVANHDGGHRHARARARKHLIRVRAAVLCGRVLQEKEPNACCVHCANPRRSRSGEGDARLVALLRIFTHVHVRKGAIGRNLPPAPASGTRRQKSGCGATAELTTTIFRSPPASTTLSTLRRRRVSGSRPPRPVPPAARGRNSAFDFRPRRDGATRASVGISNFLLLI